MTSAMGSMQLPPRETARANRMTLVATLCGIAMTFIFGFFFLVWVQAAPAKRASTSQPFIGLNQASHPGLFSGFNLGAWPTLAFGSVLFLASAVSIARPGRILAWASFLSLFGISLDIFWQGIGQTPVALGFPSKVEVKSGGSVGLFLVSIAGLVISWFYVKRFRRSSKNANVYTGPSVDPYMPPAQDSPKSRMSKASMVGVSVLGIVIAALLVVQLVHAVISNSR